MRRELLLLREMIDAAARIREIIGDLDVENLRADRLRRDAVLWNYTVLGEASSHMPDDLKEEYPSIPWAQPTRLRNRIVHGYWDVDLQILHDTATEDLVRLIEQLTALLSDLDQLTRSPQETDEVP